MTDQSTKSNINRRDFLRWVGVGFGSGGPDPLAKTRDRERQGGSDS